MKRVLGEEHAVALAAASGLAASLSMVGQSAEATGMLRTTLAMMKRVLGEDDLAALAAARNLAQALYANGQFREAVDIQRTTLAAMKRVLGEEHPETVAAVNSLARWRSKLAQLSLGTALFLFLHVLFSRE